MPSGLHDLRICRIAASLVLALSLSATSQAQESGGAASGWFQRVRNTLALQPTWPVPLVTESPRLEECYRADLRLQPDGSLAESFGDGKGLSIILPDQRVEVMITPPSYQHHKQLAVPDGFGDASLLVKYRFFPLREKRSYVFSVLLKTTLPTGDHANGAGHAIFAPMFLYGREWGPFNVQGNVAVALPTSVGGRVVVANDAFQLHLSRLLWPEVEISATSFKDGPNDGKTQTFVTPGLLFGRIPVSRHTGLAFGGGVQIAVTQFHTYNHAVVLTARLLFPDMSRPAGPPKTVF